jgi:hypothetical protein
VLTASAALTTDLHGTASATIVADAVPLARLVS